MFIKYACLQNINVYVASDYLWSHDALAGIGRFE